MIVVFQKRMDLLSVLRVGSKSQRGVIEALLRVPDFKHGTHSEFGTFNPLQAFHITNHNLTTLR